MGKNLKNGGKTGSRGDELFKIILILLSLALVVMILVAASTVRKESYRYYSRPNELLWMIRNGDYSDAVTSMYDNIALGETPAKNEDYSVPYAILEYYEAASLLKAYTGADTSDPGRKAELEAAAEQCRAKMKDARSRMGDLEFFAPEIDALFLEP